MTSPLTSTIFDLILAGLLLITISICKGCFHLTTRFSILLISTSFSSSYFDFYLDLMVLYQHDFPFKQPNLLSKRPFYKGGCHLVFIYISPQIASEMSPIVTGKHVKLTGIWLGEAGGFHLISCLRWTFFSVIIVHFAEHCVFSSFRPVILPEKWTWGRSKEGVEKGKLLSLSLVSFTIIFLVIIVRRVSSFLFHFVQSSVVSTPCLSILVMHFIQSGSPPSLKCLARPALQDPLPSFWLPGRWL